MRRVVLVLCSLGLGLGLGIGSAAAGPDQTSKFAHFFQLEVAKVDDVRGFSLPGKGTFTHLLVGTMATSENHRQSGLVLMTCDARQCSGSPLYLGVDQQVHVQGIVDLNGEGASLVVHNEPDSFAREAKRSDNYLALTKIDGGKRSTMPALVIETRHQEVRTGATRWRESHTGTERRNELFVIPLKVGKGARPRWIFRETTVDRGISGAGTTTTYELVRGKNKKLLDIVATEQRHLDDQSVCLPPPPTKHRFIVKDDRYVMDTGLDGLGGCH